MGNDYISTSGIELKEDLDHLAFVGIDDEVLQDKTEEVLLENDVPDLESNASEVNSFYSKKTSENVIKESLTMQGKKVVSIDEFLELKAANSNLKEKNNYLKKMVYDIIAQEGHITDDKASTKVQYHSARIKELTDKIEHLENFNNALHQRNSKLNEEINELRADIEARDICLETFKIGKYTSYESSQHSEAINILKS